MSKVPQKSKYVTLVSCVILLTINSHGTTKDREAKLLGKVREAES